jgi:hypothetical protein
MYGVFQFSPTIKAALDGGSFVPQKYMNSEYEAKDLYSMAVRRNSLEQLDYLDCINGYSREFQSTCGNVFLNTTGGQARPGIDVEYYYTETDHDSSCGTSDGTEWIYQQYRGENAGSCFSQNAHIYLPRLQANASQREPWGEPIDYCLGEPAEVKCKLHFSVHLLAIVVAFNLLKCLEILGAAFIVKDRPILTIGDAICSFLERPDLNTAHMGLVSQKDILTSKDGFKSQPRWSQYAGHSTRWLAAVKRGDLVCCCVAQVTPACNLDDTYTL